MADLLQNMVRDNKGRFVKGVRSSPNTEFKKGQHWREPKPYWEKEWLYNELGYESSVIPNDNPTIPPDEETPEIIPVDLSELNKKIDDIKNELDVVLDLLGEIRQHFS